MKKNMGTIDRIIRILLAIVVIILYITGSITGFAADHSGYSGNCVYNNKHDRFLPFIFALFKFPRSVNQSEVRRI